MHALITAASKDEDAFVNWNNYPFQTRHSWMSVGAGTAYFPCKQQHVSRHVETCWLWMCCHYKCGDIICIPCCCIDMMPTRPVPYQLTTVDIMSSIATGRTQTSLKEVFPFLSKSCSHRFVLRSFSAIKKNSQWLDKILCEYYHRCYA